MEIKKKKGTFNTYQCEISYGQLMAIKNALGSDHSDPVSDELYAELGWYLDNVPGPGEDEEDIKRQQDAEASGMASPEAAEQPLKQSADELLPPPEGGGEESEEGPMPPEGGEMGGPRGGDEADYGEEGYPEPEPEPAHAHGEADRRLPPPPEE